jgi:hypothetical protein
VIDLSAFNDMKSADGYRVEVVNQATNISVHLACYYKGEPSDPFDRGSDNATVEVAVLPSKDSRAVGRATRLAILLDSVCRYFTTGGNWEELDAAVAKARELIKDGITYPGFHYHDGYNTTVAQYQHVYASDGGGDVVVVWLEGDYGFIKPSTFKELAKIESEELGEPTGRPGW